MLVGCLTSQQHASVSQGRICSDNFTCCHTEIEVADPTFYLTQSQYTDTGPTSPSTDPITPGAWQGSHWSAIFRHWYDSTPKKSRRKRDSNPGSSTLEADTLPLGQRGGSVARGEGEGERTHHGRSSRVMLFNACSFCSDAPPCVTTRILIMKMRRRRKGRMRRRLHTSQQVF